jgi:hypothetical protein
MHDVRYALYDIRLGQFIGCGSIMDRWAAPITGINCGTGTHARLS